MPANVKTAATMKLRNVLFYVSLLDLRCIHLFLRGDAKCLFNLQVNTKLIFN